MTYLFIFLFLGSYQEAMENRVDFSDDEFPNRKPVRSKMTLADFDREILKAISETSIASMNQSGDLQVFLTSTPAKKRNSLIIKSTPNIAFMEEKPIETATSTRITTPTKPRRYTKHRNTGHNNYDKAVKSTPNLSEYSQDVEIIKPMPRKSSLTNRRSSSTNGISNETELINERSKADLNYSKSFSESDNNKKTKELNETRSISGSISSKGVHFCPIVAEVNWKDEHASSEHETSSASTDNDQASDRDSSSTSTLPAKEIQHQQQQQQQRQIVSSSSEREINDITDDDLPFFLKRNNDEPLNLDDIIRPEPRKPTTERRISASQPDLNLDRQNEIIKHRSSILNNVDYTFIPLRPKPHPNSEANLTDYKRRGSQIIQK